MGYGKMARKVNQISRVKFPLVPVSTERERNSDPADSGKKVLPGVKRGH